MIPKRGDFLADKNNMTNKHIVVENIVVDVVKKDIKNLHLRVMPPKGRVRITAPLRLNDNTIRLFVMSKLSWIRKHQLRFEGVENPAPLEFVSGEFHHYLGQQYALNVIFHDSKPKVELRDNTYMDLFVRMGSSSGQRQKVMTEWYRFQLKELIPDLLEKWQYVIGVEVASWSVKKMKTRWGSCLVNSRRICLNLELAKKPVSCIEFILAHELTHLLERYHNGRFKALMDSFMPQWRTLKQELNSTTF